jgi:hypothetical protein
MDHSTNRNGTVTASIRHPFRRGLPSHVVAPMHLPAVNADDSDWKLFVLSFAAFFTVFYTFIA